MPSPKFSNKNQTKGESFNPPLVFNLYKEAGPTSAQVVKHFQHNLPKNVGKIGHLGTLDPFAEGVLLLGVSGACRASDYLHQLLPKTYLARGVVGVKTDTGDCQGKEIQSSLGLDELLRDLGAPALMERWQKQFIGTYWQVPPAYSAVKFQGQRLHQLARQGKMVQKPAVARTIYALQIIELSEREVLFSVTCSSGTYLRTLFEDMLQGVGRVGHLSYLCRQSIGRFHAQEAMPKERWPVRGSAFASQAVPLTEALPLPSYCLPEKIAREYLQGRLVAVQYEQLEQDKQAQAPGTSQLDSPYIWVKDWRGRVLGMAKIIGEKNSEKFQAIFNFPLSVLD